MIWRFSPIQRVTRVLLIRARSSGSSRIWSLWIMMRYAACLVSCTPALMPRRFSISTRALLLIPSAARMTSASTRYGSLLSRGIAVKDGCGPKVSMRSASMEKWNLIAGCALHPL